MIQIHNERDLAKFFAFLAGKAQADFRVAIEVGSVLLERLRDFAEKNQINLEVVAPSGEVLLVFTAAGAAIGGVAGYLIAGLPGGVLGTLAGAAVGYSAAHLRLTWETDGDHLIVSTRN